MTEYRVPIVKTATARFLAFFPLLLFILNLLTKSLYLTSQEIGLDEPFSIYHAQFGWVTAIAQLKGYNNPPLFEMLLHIWIKLFGISPLSVRVLPLLITCFSPLVLFYFGKRNFSTAVAVTSSLLLSFSSLLLYYAHDCRVYSLFLLLSLLSMYFFMERIRHPTRATTAGWIVFSVLLIYAHYFGIFILLVQSVYLLRFYRSAILKWLSAYALLFLLYLPQLLVMWQRMNDSVKNGTWLQPPAGLESLYNMLWAFSNYPFVTVLCLFILVGGLTRGFKHRASLATDRPLTLILIWFLAPLLGMFFISYWVPMYIPRYLIFVLPGYYLVLAYCMETFITNLRWRFVVVTGTLLCFAFTLKLDPDKKQKNLEAVQMAQRLKDSTTLVLVFPWDVLPTFAYHYNPTYFATTADNKEYHLTDSLLRADHVYILNTKEVALGIINSKYQKIIYIGVGETYNSPQDPVTQALMQKNTLLYTWQFNDNCKLQVFKTPVHFRN